MSVLKVSSGSYNDTSRLVFSNRDGTGSGTDFFISAIKEQGLLISSRSDLVNNNSDSLLVLKSSGRLGLGIKNPLAKLDVDGGAKLSSFNTLELGGGVQGKETNAGKIGYRSFSADALDIVGAGSSTTDRKVYVFAEGGITLNGPVNTPGPLQLNGNSGIAGQVLTSGGSGSPIWKTSSFSNNVRFAVRVAKVDPANIAVGYRGGLLAPSSTIYNLDASAVSVGASDITINKSGLYHFEGFYNTQFYYNVFTTTNHPYNDAYFSVNYPGGFNYQIAYRDILQQSASDATSYFISRHFSTDVYIAAPKSISFSSTINNVLGPTNVVLQDGIIYGNLVSE